MTVPGRLGGLVVAVTLVTSGTALGAVAAQAGTIDASSWCHRTSQPFAPTRLAVDRVLAPTRVLARREDPEGVPLPPPLTERGKWQLAWDRASGVRPGDSAGVVRLTAHTYPFGSPRPPALGNLLLDRLRPGAVIVVSGADGEQLCYRVTRRRKVRSTSTLAGFYDTAGAPRLAILVCSGTRRGPGDWSHRTVWWAEPMSGPPPVRPVASS